MVIPSIDLMNGRVVQLRRGREKMLVRDDPFHYAEKFKKYGEIALIDLDAAMGRGENTRLVERLLRSADCRVGGGIRTVDAAWDYIAMGATKVIVGSKAFEDGVLNRPFLEKLRARVGRRHIIVAVDAVEGEIVTEGWRRKTGLGVHDIVPHLSDFADELLFTCVEKEGTLQGIDMEMVRAIAREATVRMTVAGGISSIEEVGECASAGIDVQLGMAIYTGALKLRDALSACVDWSKGLVPTVTTDEAGQVLMLAYSSPESLRRTLKDGVMWYFSRSRNQLWMKGETSGNVQELVTVRLDCDRDTLLTTVKPQGPSCHRGDYSCFGRRRFTLNELFEVVSDRLEHPRADSYTASLGKEAIYRKLLEEAQELIDASSRDEIIWEGADLLYFISVLLSKKGIGLDDVLGELRRRRFERKAYT